MGKLAHRRYWSEFWGHFFKHWKMIVFGVLGDVGSAATFIYKFPISPFFFPLLSVIAVGIASYRAFVEGVHGREEQIAKLRAKLDDFEARRPRLTAAFATSQGPKKQRGIAILQEVQPDFDAEVERKRRGLMDKYRREREARNAGRGLAQETPPGITSGFALASPDGLNPHYPAAVEQYLIEYREYLVARHEARQARRSVAYLDFIVENQGRHTAETVNVEIILPPEMPTPSEDQWHAYDEAESPPRPPQEPPLIGPSSPTYGVASSLSSILSSSAIRRIANPPMVTPAWHRMMERMHGPSYQDGGRRVRYDTIDRLNAGDPPYLLGEFPVWLGAVTHGSTFEVQVRITAEHLFPPEDQRLTFHIRCVEPPNDASDEKNAQEEDVP